MTYRIDGNVITPQFRKSLTLDLSAKTDILYSDDHIILMRVTVLLDGKPFDICHFAGDFKTGNLQQL